MMVVLDILLMVCALAFFFQRAAPASTRRGARAGAARPRAT